jgi:hypothetical protein
MSSISETLEKWYDIKKEIVTLEKKQEKYKEVVNSYLTRKQQSSVETETFSVSRRNNTRETVSKKDIPLDLWKRVCNRSTYQSLILKKR